MPSPLRSIHCSSSGAMWVTTLLSRHATQTAPVAFTAVRDGLLQPPLPEMSYRAASAPVMAVASGLSSNLIVIGSLASIIVVDAAARRGLTISARQFMRSGVPVTLASLAWSAVWLWWVA